MHGEMIALRKDIDPPSGQFGSQTRILSVAPDGQRFVFVKPEKEENVDRAHLRFIFNWFDEVRAKVPIGKN